MKKRYRIGLLIDWVDSYYHQQIILGVMEAARECDINVLVFCGGSVNAPEKWEAARNRIYALATKDIVDGLIFASGSLCRNCGIDSFIQFTRQFYSLPFVSMCEEIPHGYSLLIDNSKGFKELIDHMILTHQCKRIGFIKGPENNLDANLRYQVFCDRMSAHQLKVDSSLIVNGDFLQKSGIQAISTLLDERNAAFDCLLAANDNMALGAIEALQKRGIDVPGQVKVCGFDDMAICTIIKPGISTVRISLSRLGQKAVHLLAASLEGKEIPLKTYIETEPVIRSSCGCNNEGFGMTTDFSSVSLHQNDSGSSEQKEKDPGPADLAAWCDNLITGLMENKTIPSAGIDIIRAFLESIKDSEDIKHEEEMFARINEWLVLENGLKGILSLFDFIKNKIIPQLSEQKEIQRGYDLLFASTQKTMEHYKFIFFSQRELTRGHFAWYRNLVYGSLEDPEINDFINMIVNRIQGSVKSVNCILHIDSLPDESGILPESRILLTWDYKKAYSKHDEEIYFPTRILLPENMFPRDRQYVLHIEPLYFKDFQFGIMIFELDLKLDDFDIFRMFLFNAFNTFIIIKKLQQTFLQLKETQKELINSEKMAALGRLVAGISHEINTPIGVTLTSSTYLEDITTDLYRSFTAGTLSKKDLERYIDKATESTRLIKSNMKRATELIRSFKKVAVDQSAEEMRQFNVKDYIDDILLSLRPQLKKSSHKIMIECSPDISIYSYPGAFSQILTNFLINSLTHGYDDSESGHIMIAITLKEGILYLTYRDDGKGIDKKNVKKIFEPFFTTARAQGGTGLGLHVVYNLVTQRLKGTITCQSKIGNGTAFKISFPVEDKTIAPG
ncbi:MAG: substrate-binding domain-containing protein [Spirochaetales bacterium]|nr:substrate-binding domain-containing protein [Spirochaetales bacterium]